MEKFLIFNIDDKRYAIHANLIKEIVTETELFFVPFVPPYIRGFINRHGKPYTVFDIKVLFENEKQNSSKFLVINKEDDQIAFMVSDVVEIANLSEEDMRTLSTEEKENNYFSELLTINELDILVVNINTILEKLEKDISNE